jgi:hypothetical protein
MVVARYQRDITMNGGARDTRRARHLESGSAG